MPILAGIILISMAALWLLVHQSVKRRFAELKANLPTIHRSAVAAPTDIDEPPQLIALCIDLMRKSHCTDPYEALTPQEQHMVLHAHAIDQLPKWMSHYWAVTLPARNRDIIRQLRQVKSSRPKRRQEHYGAVKALLRSRDES